MATTRKELAKALAEACPINDDQMYKVKDVDRILAVLADVLVAQLATDGVTDIDIPGVCKISRKHRPPKPSPFTGKMVPAGWTVRATLTRPFKAAMKEAAPPPPDDA